MDITVSLVQSTGASSRCTDPINGNVKLLFSDSTQPQVVINTPNIIVAVLAVYDFNGEIQPILTRLQLILLLLVVVNMVFRGFRLAYGQVQRH